LEIFLTSHYLKGFLMTAFGVIILSFDALLIRLIDSHGHDILFWRGILMSATVAVAFKLAYPKEALFRTDWRFIRSTLLFAISSVCFVMAINLTTVANALVIISVQPLIAALLSWIFLKEKSPLITWIAILLAMLGIGWVLTDSWNGPNLTGDFLALICGIALASKFVNDRAEKQYSMIPTLIGSGLLMAAFGWFSADTVMLEGAQWGWTILLCLVVAPVAFVLITLGPKSIPAAEVGMLMLLETVIGPLWVWLFLQDSPNTAALQGGAIVIATLIIHAFLRFKMHKQKLPPVE
jgi:drug/metabolite transporter (DMT)-like permease